MAVVAVVAVMAVMAVMTEAFVVYFEACSLVV